MKTREWVVRAFDTNIARLENADFTCGSLFARGEFFNLLKIFGLLNVGTRIQVAHKNYYIKEDGLYNYLEITNLDTGVKYHGSICLEDLAENDNNLGFYYGTDTEYLTFDVRLENEWQQPY